MCLKCVLTDVVGQEVRGEALGSIALGCVVVSVPTKDQHRASQQRHRVEVAGGATLCQHPPARARERARKREEKERKAVL